MCCSRSYYHLSKPVSVFNASIKFSLAIVFRSFGIVEMCFGLWYYSNELATPCTMEFY
uniref:Uncharacterized protein n=1 Tax=Arundo donax TaxID=35708 RepID=A0A0A8YDF4_ARUDO